MSADLLPAINTIKYRLLTNLPPADITAGTVGVSVDRLGVIGNTAVFTLPDDAWQADFAYEPQLEKVLLFGGAEQASQPANIVELEVGGNLETVLFVFQAYGYFWDKQGILTAPGGPRLPLT